EFNASMFALPYLQQFANQANGGNGTGNRAQSLMDLRCTLPGLYNPTVKRNKLLFDRFYVKRSHLLFLLSPKQPSPPQQRGQIPQQREPMALPPNVQQNGKQPPPTK
ncbi:hypothetical protein DOY81_010742, partial [Sarcophaga bullata]